MSTSGTLYIVATPIGNPQDITLRALEILKTAHAVICEEVREGSTLLKKLGLPGKELITLNEHNERERITEIMARLAQNQNLALISDCGTPVFADPGHALIAEVTAGGMPVVPIPGPSSLMAALSVLDFHLDSFVFGGFLPRQPEPRRQHLQKLRGLRMAVVLMDTPYRMGALMEEVTKIFGAGQQVTLAVDLTLPSEKVYRGSASLVRQQIGARKGEFILVLHPPQGGR